MMRWLMYIVLSSVCALATVGSSWALNDSLWNKKRVEYDYNPLQEEKSKEKEQKTDAEVIDEDTGPPDLIRFYRIAAFVLISALLIYLIWYAVQKTDLKSSSTRKDGPSWQALEALDPHAPELQALLKQAERAKDPLAVIRIQFLQALKKLHDQKRIIWSSNKTNEVLGLEITDQDIRRVYFNLLDIYQPYWYGKIQPSENILERWRNLLPELMNIAEDA
jgi:hypothetical protein